MTLEYNECAESTSCFNIWSTQANELAKGFKNRKGTESQKTNIQPFGIKSNSDMFRGVAKDVGSRGGISWCHPL